MLEIGQRGLEALDRGLPDEKVVPAQEEARKNRREGRDCPPAASLGRARQQAEEERRELWSKMVKGGDEEQEHRRLEHR